MAQYPNQIYTPREKENRSGVVYNPNKKSVIFAEDIKALDEEVVAIETELGTNPKGAFASVKEFLQYLLSKVKDYLSDLLDVEISNPQDGQVLTYEAATQKWKNKEPTGGGGLGDWARKEFNTVYQAETDGFVVAYNVWTTTSWGYNPYGGEIEGYTDENNPPTTLRIKNSEVSGQVYSRELIASITMPVKKGHYWKVTKTSYAGTDNGGVVWWIPLGS